LNHTAITTQNGRKSPAVEELDNSIVDKILSIDTHDEVGMGVILDELNLKLVQVMKLEIVEQCADIYGIREGVLYSVSILIMSA